MSFNTMNYIFRYCLDSPPEDEIHKIKASAINVISHNGKTVVVEIDKRTAIQLVKELPNWRIGDEASYRNLVQGKLEQENKLRSLNLESKVIALEKELKQLKFKCASLEEENIHLKDIISGMSVPQQRN